MDNELRYAILPSPFSLFPPPEDIPVALHELIFHRVSPVHYRCLDCAYANLWWEGTENDIPAHVRTHAEMARWYEVRILPNRRK